MITQELRDKFDIPQHADMFALIYRRACELYGDEGRKAADEGTKRYGNQRGARMAKRAAKDGAPLDMRSYRLYGEWTDKNHRSQSVTRQTTPVMLPDSTVCGWCEAWKEAGLLEYGCNYCTYVDKNLVKGFNPELQLEIHSVLSQGGDVCAFEWRGFSIENEEEAKRFAEDKKALGGREIKDFLYHTGHLLSAMTEAIKENLGAEKRETVRRKALDDFEKMFGAEMTMAVIEESRQDFTEVDY